MNIGQVKGESAIKVFTLGIGVVADFKHFIS